MPVPVGVAFVDVRPDFTGFSREMKTGMTTAGTQAGSKFSGGFASSVKGIGATLAGVGIASFFGGAIDAASNLSETVSKSNAVFKGNAKSIEQWAEGGAKDFGLSKRAALEAASSFGNMFAQLGIGSEEAASMSTAIVELAADFASFANADIEEVVVAQSAAFRGEYDSLQRFLPAINGATVEQRALQLTGKATTKELTAQDKALAVNALMFEGAGDAAGDFDRTAGGLANTTRTLTGETEDLSAKIGEDLAPVMQNFKQFLLDHVTPAVRDLFSTDGDATSWATGVKDAVSDMAGFVGGVLATVSRWAADVIEDTPGNFGEGLVDNLRANADLIDESREFWHESTEEIQAAADATLNQDAALSLLGPTISTVTGKMGALGGEVKNTAESYEELAESVAAARRDLAAANRDLADATRSETEAQDEYNEALALFNVTGLDTDYDALKVAGESLKDAQDGVADANDSVADATERVGDADAKLIGDTPAVVGALGQRTTAVKGLDAAWAGLLATQTGDVGNILAGTSPAVPAPWAPSGPGGIPVHGSPLSVAAPADSRTINISQTFMEKTDPEHVAREIMWALP